MAFRAKTQQLIATVNAVLSEYEGPLTLRQVFYRLVAAQIIENTERQYKRLSSVLTKARRCGAVDGERIIDRTRHDLRVSCWADLSEFLRMARVSYRREKWDTQPAYVEVWCEKDAVAGLLQPITDEYEVRLCPCRGYDSYSAVKDAAIRFRRSGKPNIILYLGDFDPSGEDMPRDIRDRLTSDFDVTVDLRILALTRAQIEQYSLPPGMAKKKDTRAAAFIARHGDMAVELDALPQDVLQALVREALGELQDLSALAEELEAEQHEQAQLAEILAGL